MFRNFCVINFALKYFCGLGNIENILPQNIFTYTLRECRITKGISVFAAWYRTYVSDLWGCSNCKLLVFSSPLPGCPSPPLPALLNSPERLLELLLQTRANLLSPVSRLYSAGTTIEPFSPAHSCSHDCNV